MHKQAEVSISGVIRAICVQNVWVVILVQQDNISTKILLVIVQVQWEVLVVHKLRKKAAHLIKSMW